MLTEYVAKLSLSSPWVGVEPERPEDASPIWWRVFSSDGSYTVVHRRAFWLLRRRDC